MQIVKISGGLGNQLFQYAYYLKLKKMGYEAFIDDVSYLEDDWHRDSQLRNIGAEYDSADMKDILRLTDRSRDLKNWIRRRFTGSKAVLRNEGDRITDDGYWIGYWQSAEGYDGIREELQKNAFGSHFTDEITESGILKEIEASLSVSIHIRRGDYLHPDVADIYGGICTDKYYEASIEYMRKNYPGCRFYIFTNDPEWAKEKYNDSDMSVVEGNDEAHGYRDMYLMSKCKHNIIANSSFSWWGAWLNQNPEKCVIGPSIWIHRDGFDNIYTGFNVTNVTPEGVLLNG